MLLICCRRKSILYQKQHKVIVPGPLLSMYRKRIHCMPL
nr:MAG TPA: hypothetical protein [Caudoviricetes sp.]